jgi:glycosyltransferase involved in cell wall biosynthesis
VSETEERVAVSFVLPAYNEGEYIEKALKKLDSTVNGNGLRYEVVVVDDGSIDDTRVRMLRYAIRNGHVRVVGYDRNEGKGFAIKTGFWMALGDAIVFADSDLDVDFGQVKRYVDALRDGDIVIGSKWHKDSVVLVPPMRRFLGHGFNVLVKLLTGIRVADTQTGIKAIRREAFDRVFRSLSVKRYAFDVELLVAAKVFGLRVVELPVRLTISNGFRLREIWRMFLDLLGITYRLRIKRWYQSGTFRDSNL